MTCRRPNSSPAAALEDGDLLAEILLAEILLRLPPQPSSLPRASLACKRWRRLIRDPGFLRRFRAHHRSRGTAPVLGFFTEEDRGISFHPTLDPPDRIPLERFRLQITGRTENCRIVCCRDGLALLVNVHPGQVLVWDPVTGDRCSLLLPPVFRNMDKFYSGMVLRSAAAAAGDGDRFQFQVVFVRCFKGRNARAVGRSLYWSLHGNSSNAILEFDLDRQNLAVIPLHMEGWIMSAQLGLCSGSHSTTMEEGD